MLFAINLKISKEFHVKDNIRLPPTSLVELFKNTDLQFLPKVLRKVIRHPRYEIRDYYFLGVFI